MDWLSQLERNRKRGSRPRCILVMDGGREEVAGRRTRLVGLESDVIIGVGDRWMPFGKPVQREDNSWDKIPAQEARLGGLTALFARGVGKQEGAWRPAAQMVAGGSSRSKHAELGHRQHLCH